MRRREFVLGFAMMWFAMAALIAIPVENQGNPGWEMSRVEYRGPYSLEVEEWARTWVDGLKGITALGNELAARMKHVDVAYQRLAVSLMKGDFPVNFSPAEHILYRAGNRTAQ